METLAIHGGAPVKTGPFGTGKRFGDEEAALLERWSKTRYFIISAPRLNSFGRFQCDVRPGIQCGDILRHRSPSCRAWCGWRLRRG